MTLWKFTLKTLLGFFVKSECPSTMLRFNADICDEALAPYNGTIYYIGTHVRNANDPTWIRAMPSVTRVSCLLPDEIGCANILKVSV